MDSNQQTVSTFNICTEAYQTFAALRRSILLMVVFAFFIPQLIAEGVLSLLSKPTVNQLKILTEQIISLNSQVHYRLFLETAAGFFSPCLGVLLGLTLIFFAAYMGLVRIALDHQDGQAPLSVLSAFFWGLRQFFPKGILLLGLVFLMSLERFLWGPFRIFSMLILMAPVLYVAEGRRVGAAMARSLFLKYTNPAIATTFNVAFTLMVFGALLFLGESIIAETANGVLTLDESLGLSRELWTRPFLNFPFSLPFLFQKLFSAFLYSLLFASLPLFTVSLYRRFLPQIRERI